MTETTQVCNFADDTTFSVCDKDLNTLINRLEHDVIRFENNFIKLNQDKCHLKYLGEQFKKMLGVVIDRNLNFDEYAFDH